MTETYLKASIVNGRVVLTHTQRPHHEPIELTYDQWLRLVHDVYASAAQDTEAMMEDTNCWECGEAFTPQEWEDRHGTPDAKVTHAECCWMCQEFSTMPAFKGA